MVEASDTLPTQQTWVSSISILDPRHYANVNVASQPTPTSPIRLSCRLSLKTNPLHLEPLPRTSTSSGITGMSVPTTPSVTDVKTMEMTRTNGLMDWLVQVRIRSLQ
jgi:hypothetical protein